MTRVEIARVVACECPAHLRVVLVDREQGRKLRVRIDARAGRALLSEMAGLRSDLSATLDMMRDALAAAGAALDAVTLSSSGNDIRAWLRVSGRSGARDVDVEPCDALVMACRIGVPIFVSTAPSPDAAPVDGVPAVYWHALQSIDLSGIGDE